MKILFDHQIFEIQKFGGVSRYYIELFKKLKSNKQVQITISVLYSDNDYLIINNDFAPNLSIKSDNYKKFFWGIEFKGKWRLYNLINKLFPFLVPEKLNKKLSIKNIKAGNFDIFHPTYYDNYFLKIIENKPFVLTIHDMIYEKLQNKYIVNDPYSVNKKELCDKASKIIAVSQNTKNDIIELFGIESNKIDVIYLANSLKTEPDFSGLEEKMMLPELYLLFIGNRSGYKNFGFFIASISKLLKTHPEIHVVCTGGVFSTEEILLFSKLGISDKIIHRDADDKSLSLLYKKALAFVFPSVYEGFGIPILEAFSCGCPCLLSNTSSLPEVGSDAALYFNPLIESSIETAVSRIINEPELRTTLINKGYERIKEFSWEKTAKKTFQLYNEVLQRN